MDLLFAQIVVHVDEERLQLLLALSVRHNNGRAEFRRTFLRQIFAARFDVRAINQIVDIRILVHEFVVRYGFSIVAEHIVQLRHIFGGLLNQMFVHFVGGDVAVVLRVPTGPNTNDERQNYADFHDICFHIVVCTRHVRPSDASHAFSCLDTVWCVRRTVNVCFQIYVFYR